MDIDFFKIRLLYLEKRNYNNIYQNFKKDKEYLNATEKEAELCKRFKNLALSEKQQNDIKQWIAAIHAQNVAYTMVVFRIAMQCYFSLLMQLADLK